MNGFLLFFFKKNYIAKEILQWQTGFGGFVGCKMLVITLFMYYGLIRLFLARYRHVEIM